MRRLPQYLTRRLTSIPMFGVLAAVLMLLASLSLGLYNEALRRTDSTRQAMVQANILAGSVAASLAFADVEATNEYISALRANPEVWAAAVYDMHDRFVAGYAQPGIELPVHNHLTAPKFNGSILEVTAEVKQARSRLGSVYLRIATETLAHRVVRYLGISIVIVMASLFLAVLGASNASLAEAHRELQEQIKEREKAEEALRQAQKMEAMGQLTGGVAHDFNNLLMAASSGLELMERTTDPVRRERLRLGVRQAIDRGASLVQQLLAFARRTPLRPEVVDLQACISGMLDLLERTLCEDIEIQVNAAPNLWPVEVDPSQLQVAVLNIALNARDAMPNGGKIAIRIDNVPAFGPGQGNRVRLQLCDSGVGIPADLLARVFEPFFTTKEVGKGTGLGLSQVYGFARASGGEVHIDSTPGRGTTVSLSLPRSYKAIADKQAPGVSIPFRGARRQHVLLVEDDDNVGRLVAEMISELGFEVTRVANPAAALDALGRGRFDAVFSDMVMPGKMQGLELADVIAQRWPELPVILTTGYSAASAAAAAKGWHVLVKPYRMEALAAELEHAIGAPRQRSMQI